MDLAPSDAVVALRSFPRRFREVLTLHEGEDEGVLRRHGPDGRSALDHVDLAGRDLAVLGDAVQAVLTKDRPTLHPAVLDPGSRAYAHDVEPDPEAALDLLVLEANGLADRAEHVGAGEWGRTASVAGDGEVTALDVLREAVAAAAAHLRAAEKARS